MPTERLYYTDSFLCEFDAQVAEFIAPSPSEPRAALVLDHTAFYPTSGGQVFDTGWIVAGGQKLAVVEVSEREDGTVLHYVEGGPALAAGTSVHGAVDAVRRHDHMQQHSGQHVLSAAFLRLFHMPTVSFHMGADYCSIDLDSKALSAEQVVAAEKLANEVIWEDRPVTVRFVGKEEAQTLGLRKIPPVEREKLRLIDIRDFDLTACGGTHVRGTAQIGAILLRKMEKVRQGWRVEFVCGARAVAAARQDYAVLTESASLLSSRFDEVPQQIRKAQDDLRASRKGQEKLLEEIAEVYAARLLAESAESQGRKVVVQVFAERDANFIKLLAQRIVRQNSPAVALLAALAPPPTLVFAQTAGQPFDMGGLMKEMLAQLGGRGGGSKDLAQGGPQQSATLESDLLALAARLRSGN
ncbi:MAG: alanyl-tRNA editing protein [Acidobacteria bacterium]|nr:alanyl-tRNA editing protein [Acidobacteriota bacterium]